MDLGNFGTLLGALTGFVAVMLALSLVTTALAQTVQSMLRLRGRSELAALKQQHPTVDRATLDELVQYPAFEWATQWFGGRLQTQWLAGVLRWLVGPARERVTREQYTAALPRGDYEAFLVLAREAFTKTMRRVGIAASGVVAFSMQVSATGLLAALSTDPALRLRALEISGEAAKAEQELALLNIQFSQELSFYYAAGQVNWQHVVGVLITAILLSFGAPFWYEQLRALRAIGLRTKAAEAKEPRAASEALKGAEP